MGPGHQYRLGNHICPCRVYQPPPPQCWRWNSKVSRRHAANLNWVEQGCVFYTGQYGHSQHRHRQYNGLLLQTVCSKQQGADSECSRQKKQEPGRTVSVRWTPGTKKVAEKGNSLPTHSAVRAEDVMMNEIQRWQKKSIDKVEDTSASVRGEEPSQDDVRGGRNDGSVYRRRTMTRTRTRTRTRKEGSSLVEPGAVREGGSQSRRPLKAQQTWDREVQELVKLLAELPREREVSEAMAQYNTIGVAAAKDNKDNRRLRLLLQRLAEAGHSSRVPDVLAWALSWPTPNNIAIGPREFNAAINFCSKQADAESALRVFDLMMASSSSSSCCAPSVWTFNMLITASGKARRLSQAMLILSMMRSYGCAPDTITYNSLLKACEKSGQWQHALHLIQSMHQDGCAPDHYTYNALVSIMETIGHSEQAIRIIHAMRSAGIDPDIMTYNSILGAFARQGRWQEAEELWQSMGSGGGGIERDVISHNSLISCYARAGLVDRALSVIRTMKHMGLSPDVATYNGVITAVGRAGEYRKAQDLIQEMRHAGLTPDTLTYTALIGACAACREWRAAMQAYRHMLADACTPTPVTYSVLLEALRGSGRKEELQEVYAEMRNAEVDLEEERESVMSGGPPSRAAKRAQERDANLETAAEELSKLPAYKKIDDTMNKYAEGLDLRGLMRLLRCLGKTSSGIHRTTEVVVYAEESCGLETNVFVYTQLIQLLGAFGLVHQAHAAFHRMQHRRIQPTVVTYSTLVGAYSRSGDSHRAGEVIEVMIGAGMHPTVMAYTALMSAHEKRDEWDSAVSVFQRMCADGIEPTLVTYNTLIQCCTRMQDWRFALRMYEEMREKGFEANRLTYRLMLRACQCALKAGDPHPHLQQIIQRLSQQHTHTQTQTQTPSP